VDVLVADTDAGLTIEVTGFEVTGLTIEVTGTAGLIAMRTAVVETCVDLLVAAVAEEEEATVGATGCAAAATLDVVAVLSTDVRDVVDALLASVTAAAASGEG